MALPDRRTAEIAVTAAAGNLTRAARALGIARRDLLTLLGAEETRGRPTREVSSVALENALAATDGNVTAAAAILGIPRRTLAAKIAARNSAPAAEIRGKRREGEKKR